MDKIKILVVEDEIMVAVEIKEQLEKKLHDQVVAHSFKW